MKVLLIGKGAREDALAWKLSKSEVIHDVFAWPGNPGIFRTAKPTLLSSDANQEEVVDYCQKNGFDMVVVGPEGPLADGFADSLQDAGIKCFGPGQRASQLESSKAFAKDLMFRAGIPTAAFDLAQGESECRDMAFSKLHKSGGVVLKASGLAAGKGVFVCKSESEVEQGVARLYETMGEASKTVVVEELLEGRECSYFVALGQGQPVRLGFAVDFKRLYDNDEGPNTGGMGCYLPVPWLDEEAADLLDSVVVDPLLKELEREGVHYCGFLYVGVMWTNAGPKVVEFNVRLGDPEAQILVASDQRDWGRMISQKVGLLTGEVSREGSVGRAAVGVVLASHGYPYGEDERPGKIIDASMLEFSDDCINFLASVETRSGDLISGRGRVMTIVGNGESLEAAREKAYEKVREIAEQWPDARWRSDIALRVIEEG